VEPPSRAVKKKQKSKGPKLRSRHDVAGDVRRDLRVKNLGIQDTNGKKRRSGKGNRNAIKRKTGLDT